jgi:CyaY protein
MMDETAFHAQVDAMLDAVESAIDVAVDEGAEIDAMRTGGILTVEFERSGTKLIINRQTFNREIWVAAPSGGFHFRHDGTGWRDTRSGARLDHSLSAIATALADQRVEIHLPDKA